LSERNINFSPHTTGNAAGVNVFAISKKKYEGFF